MGACTLATTAQNRPYDHELLPEDVDNYDPHSHHLFQFQGSLSNVKIQNISPFVQEKLSVWFKIPDVVDIVCPLQFKQKQKIMWEINANFSLKGNDFQLRNKFLSIKVTKEKDVEICSIKINLYKIIVGPYHHDFQIFKGKKNYGRLIFDLHLVQEFLVNISSTSTSLSLMKQYPGEEFFYQIESNNPSAEKISKSKKVFASYIQKVPIVSEDQFRPATEEDEAPSPTTRIKRRGNKLVKINKVSEIQWSSKKNKQMPSLKMSIKANDINSKSFLFRLFRVSKNQKKSQFGYCSLLISDLFRTEDSPVKKFDDEIKKCKLSKKLYNNGKIIGSVKLNFNVVNKRVMKQIYSRSRTEDGIVNMHHYQTYVPEESIKDQKKSQSDQVYKSYIKLKNIINNSGNSRCKFKELEKCLTQLIQNFQNSRKKTLMYYSGNSKEKMKAKQKLSINILNLISEILIENEGNEEIRELCWKASIEITKRGEMMLRNWGFWEEEEKQKHQRMSEDVFEERAVLAEKYCQILFSLLKLALTSDIPIRGEKEQSEIFKAYCYFRIPIFRGKILDALSENSELAPEEFLSEGDFQENQLKPCSDINWEEFFYKPLQKRPKMQSLISDMDKFLENAEWMGKLAQKQGLFFDYVRYLMAKIMMIKEQTKIQGWRCLPGYDVFVSIAIQQLRSKNLCDWPYQMILMSISLLENKALLPEFLRIIFTKTNLHSDVDIRQMITILTQIFYHISKTGLSSLDFPYKFFSQGIKTLLEQSTNHLSLRLTLIFLFKFYEEFDPNYRYQMAKYCLGGVFLKFFYFWSYDVRDVFHHLIILKIFQDHEVMAFDDMSKRISVIIRIIENSLYFSRMQQPNKQKKSLHQYMREKLRQKHSNYKGHKQKKYLSLANDHTSKILQFDQLIRHQINCSEKIDITFYQIVKEDQSTDSAKSTKKTLSSNDSNLNEREEIIFQDEDTLSTLDSQYNLKMTRTVSCTSHHETTLNYGFKSQQLYLPCLQKSQLQEIRPYFEGSVSRFKQLLELIDKYYQENNQLPKMEDKLQVLGVKIDQKDILPEQLHFEFFD